jgi:hypothetical protein
VGTLLIRPVADPGHHATAQVIEKVYPLRIGRETLDR